MLLKPVAGNKLTREKKLESRTKIEFMLESTQLGQEF